MNIKIIFQNCILFFKSFFIAVTTHFFSFMVIFFCSHSEYKNMDIDIAAKHPFAYLCIFIFSVTIVSIIINKFIMAKKMRKRYVFLSSYLTLVFIDVIAHLLFYTSISSIINSFNMASHMVIISSLIMASLNILLAKIKISIEFS
ncbi:hypothetical protein [uncultured Clostridium sp.]|uniref:hypothetical protein n=1 Tax=uncultured Clostridium sp. TaxID=59620 RepID=UPI0028F08EEE|nr:hypothetical protein [uncultured Clostridium sp.]